MTIKKSITIQLSTLIIAFSSEIAMAADKSSSSSFAAWPLIVFFVVLIVLRKKIFAEATVHESDSEHQETSAEPKQEAPAAKPEAVAKTKVEKTEAKPKKAKAKAKSDSIDLSADDKQCQGSTVKGTRCKRTTTLEKATVNVDGKSYTVTVCSQHNNDKLKIFSGLLK
ncbi:MAG: hypothetical protein KAI44_09425 [Methylococcales bacterium]|nr:hypothetical protein [Methylococcales bacterium]